MLLHHNGNHEREIVAFMDETRRRRMFEDVKIICKDSVVLWGHAAVLGSLSPFLKHLLLLDIPEGDSRILLLPDVHASHMKKALEALYKGGLTLHKSLVEPILDLLHFLQCETPITEVKESPPPQFHPSTLFVQTLGEEKSLNKCVMCSKTFLHPQNLKIHLQSHLGLSVQLKKCLSCKRIFGRNLEYELHLSSHRYWQKLKHRFLHKSLNSSTSSNICNLRNKIIKRSISTLLKISQRKALQLKEISKHESESSTALLPCLTEEPIVEKKMLKLKIKNLNSPNASEADSTWCKICRRFYADVRGLKKHYRRVHSSHLSNTVELRNKSDTTTSKPIRRTPLSNREIDLTCPTCDKVFVAYSIFQRHLKTSHRSNVPSVSQNRPPPPPTPHMNKILQPTILVRGKETPKYECHLCKQVFLRVKDLAKHRAKMCSAWVN